MQRADATQTKNAEIQTAVASSAAGEATRRTYQGVGDGGIHDTIVVTESENKNPNKH